MKSIGISIVRLQQTMVAGTLAAASTAAIAQADGYAATITAPFSAPTTAPNSIEPSGLQLANDGHLYGTVCSGGSNGTGAVYRVETDGSVTTIHSLPLRPRILRSTTMESVLLPAWFRARMEIYTERHPSAV
jgi:uncharacterized repeat protein (TIGR03803 family)